MNASVIIPNYNGERLLTENLPLVIKAMNNPANNICEIIVVDDGSWDGSVRLIKEKFPLVKLIKHTKNRGFSAAVNTGARASRGDLLVLLNSDVIPNPDFLTVIKGRFQNPQVFAVSMHEKGYGWAKGEFITAFKNTPRFNRGDELNADMSSSFGRGNHGLKPVEDVIKGYTSLIKGEEGNKLYRSFYVSGGSGVFRRSFWMSLGGMDEKLFSPFYWEDVDICYRAAKRGYQILWDPESLVIHKHESTISKLSKKYVARVRERNQLLFIWKNITSASLTRRHLTGVLERLVRHPGYLRIVIMALGRLGIARKARQKEIKESRVSDEAIFSRFN